MSASLRLLLIWLRLVERRKLARLTRPDLARRRFEWQARLLFRPPRGTKQRERVLRHGERTVGSLVLIPAGPVDAADQNRPILLYFHGGAYIFGSPRTHAGLASRIAAATGMVACLPDYRLAPEHPFPAALDDALTAYRALAEAPGAPARIVLGGDSAGGGLVLALLARICALDLPRPLMTFALSPWTDLTLGGASLTANAGTEAMLPPERMAEIAAMVLQGADPSDPGASPLLADFSGAGPVWLAWSDSEILAEDGRRMSLALSRQGVEVTAEIGNGLPHVWPYLAPFLPEANATIARLAAFIAARLPR